MITICSCCRRWRSAWCSPVCIKSRDVSVRCTIRIPRVTVYRRIFIQRFVGISAVLVRSIPIITVRAVAVRVNAIRVFGRIRILVLILVSFCLAIVARSVLVTLVIASCALILVCAIRSIRDRRLRLALHRSATDNYGNRLTFFYYLTGLWDLVQDDIRLSTGAESGSSFSNVKTGMIQRIFGTYHILTNYLRHLDFGAFQRQIDCTCNPKQESNCHGNYDCQPASDGEQVLSY